MNRIAAFAFAIALLAAGQASAGVVETPECRRDLPAAEAAISRVAARDRAKRPPGDAAICATLKLNFRDMRMARDILARCLTGHERGENTGQLNDSIGDVQAVISRRCP